MNLDELLAAAQLKQAAVSTAEQAEAFRIEFLGTKGRLKQASDFLRTVEATQKREYGKKLNDVKRAVEELFAAATGRVKRPGNQPI